MEVYVLFCYFRTLTIFLISLELIHILFHILKYLILTLSNMQNSENFNVKYLLRQIKNPVSVDD